MDPEEPANVNMTLLEQLQQYGYGKLIADTMTNPERDHSEISIGAALADMDVIFGETHTIISETMKQIGNIIDSVPYGHIKGAILEMPVEMQEILSPSVLSSLTKEEFVLRARDALDLNILNTAANMLNEGIINPEQYDYMERKVEELRVARSLSQNTESSLHGSIYDMARKAMEQGTPVYAADVNREMVVIHHIAGMGGKAGLSDEQIQAFRQIISTRLDDRADAEWLEARGFSLDQPGSLIVHRGYDHINGMSRGVNSTEPTQGFDEILEARGRLTLTVAILDENLEISYRTVPDPADMTIMVGHDDTVKLDRSSHGIGEPPQMPKP